MSCFTNTVMGSAYISHSKYISTSQRSVLKLVCICIVCAGQFVPARSVWPPRQRLHDCGPGLVEWAGGGSGTPHWDFGGQLQHPQAPLPVYAGQLGVSVWIYLTRRLHLGFRFQCMLVEKGIGWPLWIRGPHSGTVWKTLGKLFSGTVEDTGETFEWQVEKTGGTCE